MTTPKTIPFFDYLRQREALGGRLDAAIARVIGSGHLILDREVERFEDAFAAYCECGFGVGVNSGTDAIQVALRAVGVGEGDEVLTVPNTSVATVSAICSTGARPVFADIRRDSMLIDPGLIAGKITERTKAVVPVHLYGRPADMDPIMAIAGERGISVIEDCAQAHGAEYRGRKVGSIGHAGCFSFYPTKNLGAYGDAGMIVTADAALAATARMVRTYGWRRRDLSEVQGVNSRLDEIQAAVLSEKLPFLDGWNLRRNELAMRYTRELSGLPLELPAPGEGIRHVYHLYVVRTPLRDALAASLARMGVTTLIHYPVPIHMQPAYAGMGGGSGSCPVSEGTQGEILSLPLYPELTDGEVDAVCSGIREFFESRP
jgi:dTDP-4-amino-4,6-dideoxygalactose transaminase